MTADISQEAIAEIRADSFNLLLNLALICDGLMAAALISSQLSTNPRLSLELLWAVMPLAVMGVALLCSYTLKEQQGTDPANGSLSWGCWRRRRSSFLSTALLSTFICS